MWEIVSNCIGEHSGSANKRSGGQYFVLIVQYTCIAILMMQYDRCFCCEAGLWPRAEMICKKSMLEVININNLSTDSVILDLKQCE